MRGVWRQVGPWALIPVAAVFWQVPAGAQDGAFPPAPAGSTGMVVRETLTRKAPPKNDLFRDPQKLLRFASQLEAKGDAEKALRFVEDAVLLDKNYRPAREMAARLALQLSQPQALAHARAYAALAPRVLAAQLMLADALLFEGQTKDIAPVLDKARSLGAAPADMALRAGLAADLEGRPQAAQDIYASALAKTPDQPALMLAMALSLTLSGDGAAGLQLAQKLANMPQGDVPATRAAIARIYAANGDVDVAVQIMESQSSKEDAEAMRPFLARIAQLTVPDKALALHYSRISREALRAAVPDVPAPASVLSAGEAVPEDISDVRIHRGSPAAAPQRAAPAYGAFYVQLAAMRAASGLQAIWAQVQKNTVGLRGAGKPWVAEMEGQYRLLMGPYPTLAAARKVAAQLQARAVHAMPRLVNRDVTLKEMQP